MSDVLVIRHAVPGVSISGTVGFTTVQGLIVTYDPTATDPNATPVLVAATGKRGFRLERDVVASLDLKDLVFKDNLFRPYIQGTEGSARKTMWEEVEDPNLLVLSGTGAISNATATGTALSTSNGQLYVAQTGDEIYGYLRQQLTPVVSGNTVRIAVEVVQ